MDKFRKAIDKQIEFNKGKNFFFERFEIFQFVTETVEAIHGLDELNPDTDEFLIDYVTDKSLEEFCRINQYYSIDTDSREDLKKIYSELIEEIKSRTTTTDKISENHYRRLKDWLLKYNSFAEKVYNKSEPYVEPVPCAEYTSELQLELLHINIGKIVLPVLDIGCGKQANLVKFIENREIEVIGIDRFRFAAENLYTADWLDFDYGRNQWGTIISHLGFSNHFKHHNLREDGNYMGYAQAFMKILYSLKIGGSFHYIPDLPFIEQYLDNKQFKINKFDISGYDFKTTIVKRLK